MPWFAEIQRWVGLPYDDHPIARGDVGLGHGGVCTSTDVCASSGQLRGDVSKSLAFMALPGNAANNVVKGQSELDRTRIQLLSMLFGNI
jgi:hypothetical protein